MAVESKSHPWKTGNIHVQHALTIRPGAVAASTFLICWQQFVAQEVLDQARTTLGWHLGLRNSLRVLYHPRKQTNVSFPLNVLGFHSGLRADREKDRNQIVPLLLLPPLTRQRHAGGTSTKRAEEGKSDRHRPHWTMLQHELATVKPIAPLPSGHIAT